MEVAESLFWLRWSRRRRAVTGTEALVGARGVVILACRPEGQIRVRGELWRARCEVHASVGETVSVRAAEGLTLLVEPVGSEGLEP